MRTEPFTQDLPHELTQDELIAKGAELSRTLDQIAHIEAEKKAAVSGFKARIEEQEQNLRRVSECIRTGEELRPTECFERMNIAERVIETVRADKGDGGLVISSRAMTADEHQLNLDAAIANMERKAKQREQDDAAAIETAGEIINAANSGGKRELLALPADTTATAKPKKKGGAQRVREAKAAAEAAKTSFAAKGKKSAPKKASASKPDAGKKPKKAKKPKPVLHSERLDGGAS